MKNKLVICSTFDAGDARRVEELGVKLMHLPFPSKSSRRGGMGAKNA